jgi:hypothetical protein
MKTHDTSSFEPSLDPATLHARRTDISNLDPEERELLESYERGEWVSDFSPERLQELQSYVRETWKIREQEEAELKKLLVVLDDGQWRSMDELASKVGSRFSQVVAEACQKGYSIEKREIDHERFEYRLTSA